jgi:predicted nucleotide-binding protein
MNEEILRRLFTSDAELNRYRSTYDSASHSDTPAKQYTEERKSTERNVERLRSVIQRLALIEIVPSSDGIPSQLQSQTTADGTLMNREVFVVHGHDTAAKESVARFLTDLDLKPIILNEQPNRTKTIIEKFEHHAASAAFAVVLLTPDDVGSAKGADTPKPRARQNVVLELGYFLGTWKRQRVCALYSGGVELPSDLDGLVYIQLDDDGAWRLKLANELDASGIDIDFNRLRTSR